MAGLLGTSYFFAGIKAWKEDGKENSYVYFPYKAKGTVNETIDRFMCNYWGFGKTPYLKTEDGTGLQISKVGAYVSGMFTYDASTEDKEKFKNELRKKLSLDEKQPILLNPILFNKGSVKLSPVFPGVVSGQSVSTMADTLVIGANSAWSLNSNDQTIAELVAEKRSSSTDSSAAMMINVSGEAKLSGEPFRAKITVNVSEVFKYFNSKSDLNVKSPWVNVNSSWADINEDLAKVGAIKFNIKEGRADSNGGMSIINATKDVFEALNKSSVDGTGFFKFPPITKEALPKTGSSSTLSKALPVGLSYRRTSVSQNVKNSASYTVDVSYTGMYTIELAGAMEVSLSANSRHEDYFQDIQHGKAGAISRDSAEQTQQRLALTNQKYDKKVEDLLTKLDNGLVKEASYALRLEHLNNQHRAEFA